MVGCWIGSTGIGGCVALSTGATAAGGLTGAVADPVSPDGCACVVWAAGRVSSGVALDELAGAPCGATSGTEAALAGCVSSLAIAVLMPFATSGPGALPIVHS